MKFALAIIGGYFWKELVYFLLKQTGHTDP